MKTIALAAAITLLACTGDVASTPAPATPPPALTATQCGPELAGFDAVAAAPLVILGELHGLDGPPAFAANFACRQALRSNGATLAVELPQSDQERLEEFLMSDGADAARSALLASPFWQSPFQDGRRSQAMLGMLEKVRVLRQAGLPLRVVAVDADPYTKVDREVFLSNALVAAVRATPRPVTMLVGNLHARVLPGASWNPTADFMAVHTKKEVPDLVSLDVRYLSGDAWICLSGKAEECGKKPVGGQQEGPAWTVNRFAAPNENGFDGTYSIGAAKASEPAIIVK